MLRLFYNNHSDKDLVKYVEGNLEKIKERARGKVKSPSLDIGCKIQGGRPKLICKETDKIIFSSKKEAKFELNKILQTNSDKKPGRTN